MTVSALRTRGPTEPWEQLQRTHHAGGGIGLARAWHIAFLLMLTGARVLPSQAASSRLISHRGRCQLPATAFVAAAIAAARRLPPDAPPAAAAAADEDSGGGGPGGRAAVMAALVGFLRDWDCGCLARDAATGKSFLALSLAAGLEPALVASLDADGKGLLGPAAARAVRHWIGLDPFLVTR